MVTRDTITRLLRKRRNEAISWFKLRSATTQPTVSPAADSSGTWTATHRSFPRSTLKGSAPPVKAAWPSAARRSPSRGPSDETETWGGWPGAWVRKAISLWVSLRIWLASASSIP